jgi:hypothetical protein
MLGCDLPSSPPETLPLLTNTDLLDVLKASRNNRELLRDGALVLWGAESTTADDRFVAMFNTGTADLVRTIPVGDLGVSAGFAGRIREAWSGDETAVGLQDGRPALEVKLPAHGVQLFRFSGQ